MRSSMIPGVRSIVNPCLPGSVNDVPEMVDFLRTLVEIGFLDGQKKPMVSFEIKPMEGQDPLLVIANAKRVMQQAWAQV